VRLAAAVSVSDTRRRVRAHRARLRAQGLGPIQFWDVRSPEFTAEAHRQARLVAASHAADADQDFVDAISAWPGE
jgi:hypothetical protein